jgi:hypothetical protein
LQVVIQNARIHFTTPDSALYPGNLLTLRARASPDKSCTDSFRGKRNNLLEMYDSSSNMIWSIMDIRLADPEPVFVVAPDYYVQRLGGAIIFVKIGSLNLNLFLTDRIE